MGLLYLYLLLTAAKKQEGTLPVRSFQISEPSSCHERYVSLAVTSGLLLIVRTLANWGGGGQNQPRVLGTLIYD
jgi:hypothetical protein